MESLGGLGASFTGTWGGGSFGNIPGVSKGLFGFDAPSVESLLVFDDGYGPKLFVGGTFLFANFVPTGGIASWNGSQWSYLDGGLRDEGSFDSPDINAMVVYDDGSGPALYAAGVFNGPAAQIGSMPAAASALWVGLPLRTLPVITVRIGGRYLPEPTP